jgi:cytochrome P450
VTPAEIVAEAAPEIDLTDLARWRDGFPHEAFVWLRREAPLWWHPVTPTTPDGVGFWVVSRHADVLRVLLDPGTFSSVGGGERTRGGTFLADTPVAGVMLNMMDDPRHRRIRELHGQKLRPGDKLTSWEMSANRDERVFREPFRFDVGRDPNPHLAFGQGVHYCLGANLARLEIRVIYEELIRRFRAFEPTGPHAWTRDNRLFGLKSLPVRAEAR